MKKVSLLLLAIFQFCCMTYAQTVENGVLKSWDGASGAITIPDEVTEIAANCFYTEGEESGDDGWGSSDPQSNTDITSVDLNNVKKIGKNAFNGCLSIETIKAGKVEEIAEGAFSKCSSLKNISLPAIKVLGKEAFAFCSEITGIELGNQLADVTDNPFKMCGAVASLTVQEGCSAFKSVNNALIRTADKTLVALAGTATEIALDATECKAIGSEALYGNAALKKVNLPGVVTIGNKALTNCSSLSELLVPNLKNVVDDSFITWNGVGSLSVVDIHLSTDFDSFGYSPFPDKATTTIYVANNTIKEKLEKTFKKCKIVVGAPGEVQKYAVTFSHNEGGTVEAWTTGGVDVVSGQEVNVGSMVRIKAVPRYGYEIEKWEVNGTVLTETLPSEGTNGQIYTVETLNAPLNVVVTFAKLPEGYVVFFKSRSPNYGKLTCKTEKGEEVTSSGLVPIGSKLTFTAVPNEGMRVTEWYKEVTSGTESSYQIIEGQTGKLTYTLDAYDAMDIQVDFERNVGTHIVTFSSLNEFATVTAKANGAEINSGAAVAEGATVEFTAHPKEGYSVDSWLLGSDVVDGEKGLTYTIQNLSADVNVSLVCAETQPEEPKDAVIVAGHLVSWTPEGAAVTPPSVTVIDREAFKGANEMTSFHVSKDVKAIGELAFLYCAKLAKITVDPENPYFTEVDGVVYTKDKTKLVAYPIGDRRENYEILASATGIVPGVFATNMYLKGVSIAKSNTAMKTVEGILYSKDGAKVLFHPVTGASEITLEEGIKTIGRYALAFNPVLEKLHLPQSLNAIEALALPYNGLLTSIEWEEGIVPELESIGDSAFYYNFSLLQLPYIGTLKSVGKAAFLNCLLLEEVHIPASCTAIGKNAFSHCRALKNVYAYAATPQNIADNLFHDIEYIDEATLYVPEGKADVYKTALGWRHFNKVVDVITGIGRTTADTAVGITAQADGYLVEGLQAGQGYAVYSLSGARVMAGKAKSNSLFLPLERGKMYILRLNDGKAYKLF